MALTTNTRNYPRLWLLTTTAIALLLLGSIAATVVLLSSTVTGEYQAALRDALTQQAGRKADRLNFVVEEIQRDVEFLRNTPPIQGIIRAENNQGEDPIDGSTQEQWKRRLATIFRAVLLAKPEYVQARYIGLADNGRELVRVEKDTRSGLLLEPEEMQQKLARPYVRDAFRGDIDDVYLSEIDLNREQGTVQKPHLPVIRASMPVYDEVTRRPFGVIVINLAASLLFESLTGNIAHGEQLLLTNEDGEYLIAPENKEAFAFEFGRSSNVRQDFPQLSHLIASGVPVQFFDEPSNHYVYARSLLSGDGQFARPLGLVLLRDGSETSQLVADIQRKTMTAISAVLVISVLSGYLLSNLLSRPLHRLAANFAGLRLADGSTPECKGLIYREAAELNSVLTQSFDELRQVNAQLKASNAELDQFAYIASHDLKEPVRSIQTTAQMVLDDPESSLSPDSRSAAEFLKQSALRMAVLIDGLLEYSRLGAQREPNRVDLNEVIENIRDDLRENIHAAKARLEVQEGLPILNLYELEVRLMFQNLIANSIKFCPPDREPRIRVTALPAVRGAWTFCVQDNGIGIPLSQQEKVFMIFRRATKRSEYVGAGIGLAHCRKVAELHNGKIWVESSSKEGTTMCVTLEEINNNET